MLEGLCLTSDAESDRNRSAVARSTVADVLWSLVLPWKGVYTETIPDSGGGDSERRLVLEMIDPDRGVVVIKRDGSEFVGVIFQGTAIEVVLDPSEGRVIGSNTGKEIRFQNGTVWTRIDSSRSSSPSSSQSMPDRDPESDAREVLRLVLTQVLLSLRWESTFLGLPHKMQAGDLVAIDATRRPLLSFLVRYAIGTRDETFVSEIYWSLWCLSEDKEDPGHIAYDKARWVLINALDGNIEFWDSVHGVQLDVWASRSCKLLALNMCQHFLHLFHQELRHAQGDLILLLIHAGICRHLQPLQVTVNHPCRQEVQRQSAALDHSAGVPSANYKWNILR